MNFFYNLWRKFRKWEPIYWLRTHTINKYHLVDCRNPDYKCGWCDIAEKILYANMNMLVDFVENDCPFSDLGGGMKSKWSVAWDDCEERKQAEKDIKEIYHWWKTDRWNEKERVNKLYEVCHWHFEPWEKDRTQSQMIFENKEAWDIAGKEDEKLDEKDDEMLLKLIKVRHYLWT